jgi:hypothetical protein
VNVINMGNRRQAYKDGDEAVPCKITFFTPAFLNEEGRQTQLNAHLTVENGDFDSFIEGVRKDGGIYVAQDDAAEASSGAPATGIIWFLPWPCAAVRIAPISVSPGDDAGLA